MEGVEFEIKQIDNEDIVQMEKEVAKLCIFTESMKNAKVGLYYESLSKFKTDSNDDIDYWGVDFSGIRHCGEKIMGIVTNDALANNVIPDSNLSWPVPAAWSFEEAATVPLPYIHAYYCLYIKGNIKNDMRVFITDGGSPFGQASISICLHLNCTVFTTVKSEEEKRLITKMFPKLPESNILEYVDEYFCCHVAHYTDNKLCDIVINSCGTKYVRQIAMKCVAQFGKFLDFCDSDMKENSPFGLSYLFNAKQYISVQFCNLFKPGNVKERETIKNLIKEGLEIGIIQPLHRPVFNPRQITDTLKKYCSATNQNNHYRYVQNNIDLNNDKMYVNHKETNMNALYSYIDRDEYFVTEPFVIMPTQLQATVETENEINENDDYLIMVPGFEGHPRIFENICENIKIRALCMTLQPDVTNKSFADMAQHIFKIIKKTLNIKSKFYILGYSVGVNIALELAALFESKGLQGTVYCLDSSPDALRTQLETYIGDLDNNHVQNEVLKHISKLISGENTEAFNRTSPGSFDDKINRCLSQLKGVMSGLSHDYVREVISSLYQRILLAKEYSPSMCLQSQVVLVAGAGGVRGAGNLSKDYGLGRYCAHKVTLYEVPADHVSILQRWQVADAINKTLDANILEDFHKKNLCVNYVS